MPTSRHIYTSHTVHRPGTVPVINYLRLSGRLKPILRSAFFFRPVNYAIGGRRGGQPEWDKGNDGHGWTERWKESEGKSGA